MPPSGYSTGAVSGLMVFFRETLRDLEREVTQGKHVDLSAGLHFEIAQIARALGTGADHGTLSTNEKSLLQLTKSFYEQVLEVGADEALVWVETSTLAMHIDEHGQLTRR